MNKKFLALSFVVLGGLVSIATVVGVFSDFNAIEKTVAEEPTDTDQKRIYVVLEDYWWTANENFDGSLYMWYSNLGTFENDVKMTLVGSSNNTESSGFRYGLYYVDLPSSVSEIVVKAYTGTWTQDWLQTVDYTLDNTEDYALYLWNDDYDGTDKRQMSGGIVSLGSEELYTLLTEHIDTCDPSILNGYNAYPQLYSIFLKDNSNYSGIYKPSGSDYSIDDICDALAARYAAQNSKASY